MRQEAKEVDGPEIEHAEERKRANELVEEDEEELYDLDPQNEFVNDEEHSGSVLAAMTQIFEREQIVINDLKLPQRELRALEALKTAVEGRDGELSRFVFAEDRRTLLEQALAVLQPNIASLDGLGKPLEDLLKRVGEVRDTLNTLEDAQEEPELRWREQAKGEEGDTDDKPDDKDDDDASLTGPERKVDKPKSTLAGPERKDEPKPASTLSGPEPKVEKKPSSLDGPEVKQAAKPETTLGDPKEIAASAKKPSWKRGDGG